MVHILALVESQLDLWKQELFSSFGNPLLSERLLRVACDGDCREKRLAYAFSVMDIHRPSTRLLLVELLATKLSRSSSAIALWMETVQTVYPLLQEYFEALVPERFAHIPALLSLFLQHDMDLAAKQEIATLCLAPIEKHDIDLPDDLDLRSLRQIPLPYLRRRAPLYGTYQTQNPVVSQTMLQFLADCRLPHACSLSFLCELYTYAHGIRAYRFLDKVEAKFFTKTVEAFDLGPLASLLTLANQPFREKLAHLLLAEVYNSPFRTLQNEVLAKVKATALPNLQVAKILERTKQKVLTVPFAKWLSQQVPDVTTVDLTFVKAEIGAIKALTEGLPKLKGLVLNGEQEVSSLPISELTLYNATYDSLTCCLDLPLKGLRLHEFEWADRVLQRLLEKEPKAKPFFARLEAFHLERKTHSMNLEHLSDTGAATLFALTGKLQAMSLNVLSLTNRSLQTIEEHIPHIRSFSGSVSLSKPEHYEQIAAFCKKYEQLEHLGLKISYLGDADAVRFATLFHPLRALKAFKVSFVLDDPALALFVKHHLGLTTLELEHCDGVTDQSIENLASLQQLETLSLEATGMTAAGIARLAKRLLKLKKLSFKLRDKDDLCGERANALRYRLLRPDLEVELIPGKRSIWD